MKLSRWTLTMAIAAIVLYVAKPTAADELQTPETQVVVEPRREAWMMEIQPAGKKSQVPAIPLKTPTVAGETAVYDPAAYSRIYKSIPFNRTEYDANPNYRHDSTMEILTGNARHQTIVQHNFEHKQPVKRIPAPTQPSRILTPFATPSFLYGGGMFGYGSGSFGYGGGLRRW